MSTKEEKPTLAGVQIKTRKRNIAVALDPGSFADAVVTIFEDARVDGDNLDQGLQGGVKILESAELDFSRYGDTLFEVLFAGGRMAAGGNVVEEGRKLNTNMLAAEATREAVQPYVKVFQMLLRRRPFLIRPLENTLIKLLRSLDFYDELGRSKIAMATARCFASKLGIQSDRVLNAVMNDRMIAKGLVLHWATAFFVDFLATEPMDDLVAILRKARLDDRLLDLFPPHKRTLADLESHFMAAGLKPLVDYSKKKTAEKHLEELTVNLGELVGADPPLPEADLIAAAKAKKLEWQLPGEEVVKVVWSVLIDAVPTHGRNAQQITGAVTKQIKTYAKLLNEFTATAKLEAALLVHVQVYCYEDSKLLKVFQAIVRALYDADVLGEDTIIWWAKKGAHPKGRNVFQRDMEPFIKWLEEAEAEGDEEEDEE